MLPISYCIFISGGMKRPACKGSSSQRFCRFLLPNAAICGTIVLVQRHNSRTAPAITISMVTFSGPRTPGVFHGRTHVRGAERWQGHVVQPDPLALLAPVFGNSKGTEMTNTP